MELDWDKNFVDAIYQEFKINKTKTLMFDMKARREWTSDFELYIDGNYVKTITPTRRYSTYTYDKELQPWVHSIIFKELKSQDNWLWALIDNVRVIAKSDMRTENPNPNNKIAVAAYKWIMNDAWLKKNVTLDDKLDAVHDSNIMADIIYKSIKATKIWLGKNGYTADDIKKLDHYIYEHYNSVMIRYHGNDENTYQTWYHKIQNNWATWKIMIWWRERNAINTVIDSFYHLWLFDVLNNNRILNEDGNKNARWSDMAKRFNQAIPVSELHFKK